MRGLYIALEGPEGSGKTTQLRRLAARLRQRGLEVVEVREPGSTALGEQVRALLEDPAHGDMTAEAEALLFAAARAQLLRCVVRPALEQGRVVLSDRCVYASLAYQGYGRGLGEEVVRRVNEVATGGLLPDLVVLLDLPVEEGLVRDAGKSRSGGDRIGQEAVEFHRRVREGYLRLSREDRRIRVVRADDDPDRVAEQVWEAVRPLVEGCREAP
ncbi:MAG: dTMP kinase [Armatimonadota bacterium]|nr:dTMP kinase [Armatimonadota bacterium]MDW8156552.1 dTMP kinase [Armatimonadota bacterium]